MDEVPAELPNNSARECPRKRRRPRPSALIPPLVDSRSLGSRGCCLFPKVRFTFELARLSAEKRAALPLTSKLRSWTEELMEQVLEQVIESEEVVELSLAELAQVGGGVGVADFS